WRSCGAPFLGPERALPALGLSCPDCAPDGVRFALEATPNAPLNLSLRTAPAWSERPIAARPIEETRRAKALARPRPLPPPPPDRRRTRAPARWEAGSGSPGRRRRG